MLLLFLKRTPKTVVKTTTYAAMHFVVAFLVAWGVSGDLLIALGISLIEPAVQTVAFYFHERAWEVKA